MYKFILISSLFLLSGCATNDSVNVINDKVMSIQTELNETNVKLEEISENQVSQQTYIENEIKRITVESINIYAKISKAQSLIERINANLSRLNKNTNAISHKIFPENYPIKEIPPIKENTPIKESSPIKEGSSIKENTPIKESSPIKENTPIKESSPTKEGSPVKENPPIKKELKERIKEHVSEWL